MGRTVSKYASLGRASSRKLGLGLLSLVAACGDFPITTSQACGYGEHSGAFETLPANAVYDTYLIVIQPAVARQLDVQLRELIGAMVTGDRDDVAGQDRFVSPIVRVAFATPATAADLAIRTQKRQRCRDEVEEPDQCPASPAVPFVRYQWAPYGLHDDVESFVERAMCLLTGPVDACEDSQLEDLLPLTEAYPRVLVISDVDSCGPVHTDQLCDGQLTELFEILERRRPSGWTPHLIAGVPKHLATVEAWSEAQGPREYLSQIASAPRVRVGAANICDPTDPISAAAAPELLRAMWSLASSDGSFGGGAISICADDFRPALGMFDGAAVVSLGGAIIGLDSLLWRPDGTAECELTETLPFTGRLTGCDQLEAFGRSFVDTRPDGRQVCTVTQLRPAEISDDFGWYLTTNRRADLGTTARGEWWYWSAGPIDEPKPAAGLAPRGLGALTFSAGVQLVAGAEYEFRCTRIPPDPDVPLCD